MKITIDENDKITVELDNGHVQTFPEGWQEDCVKAAVQKEKADAWEARCAELEQELREAQDRIHELDWTIARYDDENRKLRRVLGVHEIPLSIMDQADSVYAEARGIGKAFRCWAGIIHKSAVEHGWWETEDGKCDDGERNFAEICMMCVTELAEAVNEYRNDKPLLYEGEDGKPEGVAVEMVDCIIRLLDWLGHEGVDVDAVLSEKYSFNLTRPHRHGGKKL